MEAVVEQLILLKPMIITTAAGTILLGVVMFFLCSQFSFQEKNQKLMGFFFDMSISDSIIIAVCLLKLFLVLSLMFSKGRIEIIHIALFGVLVIVYNIFLHKWKEAMISLVNGAVIMGVLIVVKFLVSYLTEILFDIRIAAALALIGLFLALYSFYDVSCCVLAIVEKRRKRKQETLK
ncbi:MAG TPA: hypothetical protein PLQ04_04940 [Lachnospiraceae bacterium]|nr:hypothetical protein [Lachnospiraceae bacterium]